MNSISKTLSCIIPIFALKNKTYADLETLNHFLGQFEDMRRYLDHYNLEIRFKIIESFAIQKFSPGEVIFRKGDPSSYYYFILDGQIAAYNEERDGSSKLLGIVSTGKPLGEIGILRNQPRSLTCIAKTSGHYLILTSQNFLNLLASHMVTLIEQKIKFIEQFFPNVKKLTTVQKQRISYAMGSFTMSRGQVLSNVGENVQVLYFIREGECIVNLTSDKSGQHMILKLAPGNIVGEECIFFGSPLKFSISVSSEYAQIYSLQKQDIYFLLPPETIDIWKRNFRAKDFCRKKLIEGLSQSSISSTQLTRTYSNYKQATFYASKRLDAIQKLNERSQNSMSSFSKNSSIEKTLKLFSPAAIMSHGKKIGKPRSAFLLNRLVSKHN